MHSRVRSIANQIGAPDLNGHYLIIRVKKSQIITGLILMLKSLLLHQIHSFVRNEQLGVYSCNHGMQDSQLENYSCVQRHNGQRLDE